jgi:hypothetical protein
VLRTTIVASGWELGDLKAAIWRYLDETNTRPKPFIWTKTADEILDNLARFCRRTSETGTLGESRREGLGLDLLHFDVKFREFRIE